jgi:hypothetical protein
VDISFPVWSRKMDVGSVEASEVVEAEVFFSSIFSFPVAFGHCLSLPLRSMDECSIDDSYLQLVPDLSPDDLQDLYQYVGIFGGEEAQCCVERIGSGGGSLVERIPSGGSVTELQRVESSAKKSNSQQQQSKARRWLLKYVTEYETERQSNWDKRYLQESRIWDTIAYALHYLAGARLSFGGHDQMWQGGLLKEMKRLKQEQDEVLVLVRSPTLFLRSLCLTVLVAGAANLSCIQAFHVQKRAGFSTRN